MKDYGKLVENTLIRAPKTRTINNVYYNPTPLFWLTENEYREIVYRDKPETAPSEGYHWAERYTDGGSVIVRVWVEEEDEPTIDEKIRLFLKTNLKKITTKDTDGRDVPSYVLVFNTATPVVNTGDDALNRFIKGNLHKTTITNNEGGVSVVYTTLFDAETLKRWGIDV